MDEKKLFITQMDKLIKYGRENGNLVTKQDVDTFFKDIPFDDEKKQLIYNFLYDSRIGVDEPFDFDEVLDEDDVDFLQMYIDELEGVKKYTQKEKHELLRRFADGEGLLRDKVIESYLHDIVEMSKLYTGSGVPIEDLIGEGNVALAVILESLDSKCSAKELDGFITEGIMSAMEELLYDDNNEAAKTNTWAENANEVLEKAKELYETLQRNVTIEELCKFGDFEEDFIKEVLQITGGIEIIDEPK
jgi:RNA polymerase primary sigma factor